MEKLKYDSLYKFIVSIGIVIILLPFAFVYGTLSNNEVVMIKENEISQLTNTAKEIILLEQNYKHIVVSNPVIFFSVATIFIVSGIIIVIYGILQWKNKVQKYEDKSKELSIQLLEKQIENLTNEEKTEKIIKDMEVLNTENNIKFLNDDLKKQQISKYVDIQAEAYKSIRKVFKDYRIFEEIRIDKQMYDCIAVNTSRNYIYDYIFEIKYFSTTESIREKIESIDKMMLREKMCYYESSKRLAKNILIIVVENISKKANIENKKNLDEMNSNISKIIITDIGGIEEELKNIKNI